ncbi:MAG: hypothetical protein JWP62_3790 [Blastococcus sp.]|nr:hypothetical protein [Blastococcus sp.]
MYANRVIGEVAAPRWDDHNRDDNRRNSRRSRSRERNRSRGW